MYKTCHVAHKYTGAVWHNASFLLISRQQHSVYISANMKSMKIRVFACRHDYRFCQNWRFHKSESIYLHGIKTCMHWMIGNYIRICDFPFTTHLQKHRRPQINVFDYWTPELTVTISKIILIWNQGYAKKISRHYTLSLFRCLTLSLVAGFHADSPILFRI